MWSCRLPVLGDGRWRTDAELWARLAEPDWPFVADTRMLLPQWLIG